MSAVNRQRTCTIRAPRRGSAHLVPVVPKSYWTRGMFKETWKISMLGEKVNKELSRKKKGVNA